MNGLAIQSMERLRRVAKLHQRNKAEWYFAELTDYSLALRDAEIEHRVDRIWAVHDSPALQAEFDKRISPKACPERKPALSLSKGRRGFNIGFSFDISDVDENADDEQWAAAWQLAIESLDTDPPELPDFDLDGIKSCLEQTSQPQPALF